MRLIAVAAIFAAGAIVSRLLLATAPARLAIDLAQPIPVVTWWGESGAIFVSILLAAIMLASIAYAAFLRGNAPAVRTTVAAAAIAIVAAFFWLPLFSSDVYAYAAYGEMARIGIDPYVRTALPQTDAIFHAATWQWSGSLPVCVYGSLFVFIAQLIVTATHHLSVTLQLDAFRILSCAAFLCSIFLIAQCGLRGDEERARRAALFFALNPVVLWAAAEGHNDTLMLAVVLSGIALYRRNAAAGTFVTILAATIKVPAILAGGTLALTAMIERRDWRTFAAAIAAFAVVIAASLPLVYGTSHDLAPHGRYMPFASVQSLHPVVAVLVALAVLYRARYAASTVDRCGTLALAAWLAIPNPYPWYALWLLPLGAWATDRRIASAIVLVSAAATLRYIPDAIAIPNGPATVALGLAALLGYTPLLWRGIIGRS